jgi:signal transduction histidine kinase
MQTIFALMKSATVFILLRTISYIAILALIGFRGLELSSIQWIISIIVVSWNSWDQWKKPNEPIFWMRVGLWTETILIVIWSITIGDGMILFLFISPILRASIHLNMRDELLVFSSHMITTVLLYFFWLKDWNHFYILLVTLTGVGLYGMVLGMLIKERKQSERYITLTAFEREQTSKDQERTRIAGQLHDVMGQYWTSIVRALDVAIASDGAQSKEFIAKARNAALEGLQEMRSNVHDWQDGRQTPHQWMNYLLKSIDRFREVTGIEVSMDIEDIAWNQFEDPTTIAEFFSRSGIEAMTNAVRHGDAKSIKLSIRSQEAEVEMIVCDDGSGIYKMEYQRGIGLSTIKQRIELMNGQWEITSGKGHGTQIKLTLPIA